MTDCSSAEMRDRLPDLLHERLDPSARAAVMAHVADCQDCDLEFALLREARVAISSGIRVVDVTTIARIVVERAPTARTLPASRTRWLDWRIAASVLFLAIGGASIVRLRGRGDVATQPLAPVSVEGPSPAVDVSAAPAPESVASTSVGSPAQAAELSAAGGVNDLSDSDLRALVDDLQTLDALPPTDAEPVMVRVAVPGSGSSE